MIADDPNSESASCMFVIGLGIVIFLVFFAAWLYSVSGR